MFYRMLMVCLGTALLVGCASQAEPVGTGNGINGGPEAYPTSPCACVEIDLKPSTPDYLKRLSRRIG